MATLGDRLAAIDVGTNTVLLLVAERRGGVLAPVLERAEITRLGRGVDATGRLDPAAIRETVRVLADFAASARSLGAARIACVATSAARDASNGAQFFEEARLVWTSAWRDFGPSSGATPTGGAAAGPLAVLDVGGGSTELSFGDGPIPRGRTSLQVGAVRLTERHVRSDPPTPAETARLRQAARDALLPLGRLALPPEGRLVGVAGTVTTLSAVAQALPVYDAARVHGATLARAEVEALVARLAALTVAQRAALPGMEPKRADVILAGAIVVAEAMATLGFDRLTVSDRGVRWGLLHDRFGS